jgi:hypothetical protein
VPERTTACGRTYAYSGSRRMPATPNAFNVTCRRCISLMLPSEQRMRATYNILRDMAKTHRRRYRNVREFLSRYAALSNLCRGAHYAGSVKEMLGG